MEYIEEKNGNFVQKITHDDLWKKRLEKLSQNIDTAQKLYRHDWNFEKKIPKPASSILPVLLYLIPFPCNFCRKEGNLIVCFDELDKDKFLSVREILDKYFQNKKKKYMEKVSFIPVGFCLNKKSSFVVIEK